MTLRLLELFRALFARSERSAALVLALLVALAGQSAAVELSGNIAAHDPSTIIKDRGQYWIFSTGKGVRSHRSKDLHTWEAGPTIIPQPAPWVAAVVPENQGIYWAPEIFRIGERFYLYYSASSFGKNISAIGLVSSPTLDPADPAYAWRDDGMIVSSQKGDKFNAIDPAVSFGENGRLWMSYGSFWSGIKLLELDPKTGLRIAPGSPVYSLAAHSSIEAPAIHREGDFYYLFVNWGLCCRGTESTYEIRVGRSREITGPYVDREGVDLLNGGGTLFLATAGDEIGPGHAGIFNEDGVQWLSYHFYNAANRGRARFALRELHWSAAGWPEVTRGAASVAP